MHVQPYVPYTCRLSTAHNKILLSVINQLKKLIWRDCDPEIIKLLHYSPIPYNISWSEQTFPLPIPKWEKKHVWSSYLSAWVSTWGQYMIWPVMLQKRLGCHGTRHIHDRSPQNMYWYVLNCQLTSGSATLSIELRTSNFLAKSG